MTVRIVYYDSALSDVDIVNTVVGFRFSSRLLPYRVARRPFSLRTRRLLKNHMLGSDSRAPIRPPHVKGQGR